MNQHVKIALALVGLLGFVACQKLADPEMVKANARELDNKWTTAFVNQDIKAIMDCYWDSSDAVFYFSDTREKHGLEAIKVWYLVFFAVNQVKEAKLVGATYVALGDNALGFSQWTVNVETQGGKGVILQGHRTAISSLRDGKWVYIYDHASELLPPPPEPLTEPGKTTKKSSKKKML